MMMKPQSVSAQLGVTQKEMAMLLRVSRSQLAMFEIGKGNLPMGATQLLGHLLALAQSAEAGDQSRSQAARQHSQRRLHLESLLQENEYRRQLITKTAKAAERKAEKDATLRRLADFIEQRPAAKTNTDATNVQFLVHKAETSKSPDAGATLLKLQVKLELLEVEKRYLESQLNAG